MPEVPDHAAAGGGVDGGPLNPNRAGIDKRMRESAGVYDNTTKPLNASQRRASEGTTFKAPQIKKPVSAGSRTII